MGKSYFWKPFAQGVATPIVLIGGTNLLLKDFKVSNPYLYWGGLAASSALVVGILADKVKVPILNAEFEAHDVKCECGTTIGTDEEIYMNSVPFEVIDIEDGWKVVCMNCAKSFDAETEIPKKVIKDSWKQARRKAPVTASNWSDWSGRDGGLNENRFKEGFIDGWNKAREKVNGKMRWELVKETLDFKHRDYSVSYYGDGWNYANGMRMGFDESWKALDDEPIPTPEFVEYYIKKEVNGMPITFEEVWADGPMKVVVQQTKGKNPSTNKIHDDFKKVFVINENYKNYYVGSIPKAYGGLRIKLEDRINDAIKMAKGDSYFDADYTKGYTDVTEKIQSKDKYGRPKETIVQSMKGYAGNCPSCDKRINFPVSGGGLYCYDCQVYLRASKEKGFNKTLQYDAETFEAKVYDPMMQKKIDQNECTHKFGDGEDAWNLVYSDIDRNGFSYVYATVKCDMCSQERYGSWGINEKEGFEIVKGEEGRMPKMYGFYGAESEDCEVCYTTVDKGTLNDVQAGRICNECHRMNQYTGGTRTIKTPYNAETFESDYDDEKIRDWLKTNYMTFNELLENHYTYEGLMAWLSENHDEVYEEWMNSNQRGIAHRTPYQKIYDAESFGAEMTKVKITAKGGKETMVEIPTKIPHPFENSTINTKNVSENAQLESYVGDWIRDNHGDFYDFKIMGAETTMTVEHKDGSKYRYSETDPIYGEMGEIVGHVSEITDEKDTPYQKIYGRDVTREHNFYLNHAETFNSDSHTDSSMPDKPVNAISSQNGGWYIPSIHRKDYKEAFKNWKPSKYPYEKRITQNSVNEGCNSCGKENVHYQFYLPRTNSVNPKMRFVDGATYCHYDTNNCGGNICGDCAEDASCENCGAEICSYCEQENNYDHSDLVCVDCREFNESLEDD